MAILAISPPPHPAFFQLLLQTKPLVLFDAWEALAWRLGGPSVTQSQSQSQSAEGRNLLKLRGANFAAPQTVIVSERRYRGPRQARFSLAGARLAGSRTI